MLDTGRVQLDTRFERGCDISNATTEALMHFVIAYAISEECHCRYGTTLQNSKEP